ncbi:WLM domain-containing protein [Dunaliella salina]|uniref:WLM domain-containing protein n=1 Tax=Dunaliella salina TaxID=3046 RepID=A0ABQ7GYZ6_DUNSA|nr:WLM domain-containing protein [Dunaliella salina]|eukprot:KAF5839828.1 WLM domain-containing protein [Dunaliella salina]
MVPGKWVSIEDVEDKKDQGIIGALLQIVEARTMLDHFEAFGNAEHEVTWDAPPVLLTGREAMRCMVYAAKSAAEMTFDTTAFKKDTLDVNKGIHKLFFQVVFYVMPKGLLRLLLPKDIPIQADVAVTVVRDRAEPMDSPGRIHSIEGRWHNLPMLPLPLRFFNALAMGHFLHATETIWHLPLAPHTPHTHQHLWPRLKVLWWMKFCTPFTFHDYQVLPERPGVFPPPKEALKLLHRLASDSSIVHIMKDNQFSVGSLREMPPEGLVGISETCILGYNVNRGQEIHLRLRTDNGKGFRKYQSILQTLCHELTHNVHGPHDNNFKALCSKLNKDVNSVNARLSQGGQRAVLHGGDLPNGEDEDSANEARQQHAAMAATQASSGKTMRQLAAEGKQPGPPSAQQQMSGPAAVEALKTSADEAGSEREEDLGDVAFVYEHKQAETEELEKKQRALEQ